ncbi:DEAD/DEAH box helicase [Virgibacillus kimchii]
MTYYRQNKVSDVSFDMNNNVWTAVVRGSSKYFVEINMDGFEQGYLGTYCECPAYEAYGSCKHIAATLISIVNRKPGSTSSYSAFDYQTTNRFMRALSEARPGVESIDLPQAKTPLKIEYYCKWNYNKQLTIELKAGEKRCFVVKNASEFISNVMGGREQYFTKTFTYNPEIHYLQSEDLPIFEQLYSIIKNEQIYNDHSFYYYQGGSDNKRAMIIPPLAAKSLLEALVERNFTVESGHRSYQPIHIEKDRLPFNFHLSKNNKEELVLKMDGMKDIVYFDKYELLFYAGTFYYPAKEQVPILDQVTGFGTNLSLPVEKNKADTFLSEALPTLKKIGEVQVEESVAEEIIQVPLRAKLFLELKEDWILGKLEYHYGSHEIDPFNGRKAHDTFIIRDVEKEHQIMQLIEYANFRYNGRELYMEAYEDDDIYNFLYHILPQLDEELELFLTSEVRKLIVETEPKPSTSVSLESSANLLEIGFSIDGVNDEEINRILDAIIEKKRYYRLDSGALMSLEGEEFSSIQRLFDDMEIEKSDVQEGNVSVPVFRGTQLDELIETNKNYDPAFRKLLHQLKSPEEQIYPLPENLSANLRNYQHTGYQWFKSLSNYHLGGILADDMGLGKTLQSIAYIASEKGEQPHLIVAPSSVVYNWKNECAKFAPDLEVAVLTGTPAERHKKLKESDDADVWITSYATLRQDVELYRELTFQTMILDEAQYIKNYATKTSKAIRQVKAGRRFALSGTPIENSIDELWAIFQVILPGLLPNQRNFKQLSHEKIARMTKPFILRRLKQDVLKELPEKIESVHVSELTKEQKDLYIGYHRQLQVEAAASMKESGFQQNRMKILAGLTRLRQICCHPSLFIENYEGQSGKLEQLMETVRNAVENGKRMLIFSQFTSMHEIIMEKLEQEGISYFYLHGQTPSKERVEMSERFNNGENDVFLISLKAGGTGLNLTGADTVILYDLWWNPAVEDQATGRAHRFGQKNVVQVIRLITEGTIEEKIYELQQKKRELIDQVIQPGETMLSSLSEEDVRELLNI